MNRFPFLLSLLLAACLFACDSNVIDEPDGLPDTTGTPPPSTPPVDMGNLKFIGHANAWEAVGTGYPTGWRYASTSRRDDSTGTQLNQVRTLGGNLVLSDSFHFTTYLNVGGYDHRDKVWRDRNDSVAVKGVYEQAGVWLLLEPETCNPSRGPLLGVRGSREVAINRPGSAWEHRDVSWLRFEMPHTITIQPLALPEGTYTLSEAAYGNTPCTLQALPLYLGGNRYESKSLQAIEVHITGDRLLIAVTSLYTTCFAGNCGSNTVTQNIDAVYQRQGDIVVAGVIPAVPGGLGTEPLMFGLVKNDTLVLHGVRAASVGATGNTGGTMALVLRVPLR